MGADSLIDTGAILALLDRTDRWHKICEETLRELRLPLVTSEAVLAELFHLIGESRHEMEGAWKFIRSGALRPAEIEDSELPQIHMLMLRYGDRPMDFCRCHSCTSCKARIAIHYFHSGSCGFRDIPNRRPPAVQGSSGSPAVRRSEAL